MGKQRSSRNLATKLAERTQDDTCIQKKLCEGKNYMNLDLDTIGLRK